MNPVRHCVVLGALLSAAVSQHVTWTLSTPTGLSTTATVGTGAPVTQTLPAGPLAASGSLVAAPASFHASSSVSWFALSNPGFASVRLTETLLVTPNAPAGSSAATGPHEYMLQVSAQSLTQVEVQLLHDAMFSVGAPAAELTVDVGNDGTIEFRAGEPSPILNLFIGLTPLPVLVRIGGTLPAAGSSWQTLGISVTPHNLLDIDQIVAGCGGQLFAAPSFTGNGAQFIAPNATLTQPAVLVLGLSAQPQVLPPSGALPCLLIPAPDLLVLCTDSTPFTLPLPVSVRPLVLWAQAAHLTPQLSLSEGYRIAADI